MSPPLSFIALPSHGLPSTAGGDGAPSLLEPRPLGSPAADRLALLVGPLLARVRAPELQELARTVDPDRPEAEVLARLVAYMDLAQGQRASIQARADSLRAEALQAPPEARQELVIAHLHRIGVGDGDLRRDLRAAAQGQLDLGCMLEREGARIDRQGARLELAARVAGALDLPPDPGLIARLCRLAEGDPRRPTRLAAVTALARLHGRFPDERTRPAAELLRQLLQPAGRDPFAARAALLLTLQLPPDQAEPWLHCVLAEPPRSGTAAADDALVRARAVELGLDRDDLPGLDSALLALVEDDSELVRFTLAMGAADRLRRGAPRAMEAVQAVLGARDLRIRCRLAWSLRSCGAAGLDLLQGLFTAPEALARMGLDAAIAALQDGVAPTQALHEALQALPETLPVPVARRVELLRCLVLAWHSPARAIAAELARMKPGEMTELRLPADLQPVDLARALIPHAAQGHGFSLDPDGPLDRRGVTLTVTRGDVRSPALWRLLDELRHPAPAKRQAFTHAVGRADRGPLRVPPLGLAEAVPTGVPGQRVLSEEQDGWAPEVPLVDDLLQALSYEELVLATPRGLVRLRPPRGAAAWRARLRLLWGFRRFDQVRLAALQARDPDLAGPWHQAMAGLGFRVEREPHAPRAAPGPGAAAWIDPLTFALGLGGSTLPHLSALVLILAALLFGRLSWAGLRIRRARARIPLVLGGWGTRGKSGTERLKAGLMEALGLPFLSKTTGCEAMILHAPDGGHARELFLYRPYDKATIWEQADVAILAPELGARVLLWECMALNPNYVELLQSRWMRDDVATLTNAFPDHEDIQGPTGEDVATVIGGFSSPGRPLLTTEEGMLPVLRSVAERRASPLTAIPRPEHQLMPRDLLQRFRHTEHPANVTLVANLAAGLGVDPVEAVCFMAERVVADVGALVLHVPVDTEGRRVAFGQGMSANDPLSFRHNWRTAGFEAPCPPWEWRVSVVNNRADRIARSRMFAGLLADTASAHRHVLIGTNLAGLQSYLAEAVEIRLSTMDLGSAEAAEALIAHVRLGDAGEVGAAMVERLGVGPAERVAWKEAVAALVPAGPSWSACQAAARGAEGAARRLVAALPPGASDFAQDLHGHLLDLVARHLAMGALRRAGPAERKGLYRELVTASLVVVHDSGASGDQIIGAAVHSAPPGAWIRLMGLQNIKGTGLDFAYRWVEWGELNPTLARLAEAGADERRRLLGELGTRGYGSVMACDGAWAALQGLPQSPELDAAAAHLRATRTALLAARARSGGKKQVGLRGQVLQVLERILDPLDGVWRKARARTLLAELAAERISHERAQTELAALTKRQKGGWLAG